MSKRMKTLIPLVLGTGFVAYLIYSSLGLSPITCEVTMEFRGRTETRQASGVTRDEATTTAINNACTLITNGRDESIACGAREPARVECAES
jgi:hypothetical protein